jgi:hypothetical protein
VLYRSLATGYNPDGDREHRNTDLLSRGLTSGSGIIIASDGWMVTNAHVVQGGRRIRVQLNPEAALSAPQNGGSSYSVTLQLLKTPNSMRSRHGAFLSIHGKARLCPLCKKENKYDGRSSSTDWRYRYGSALAFSRQTRLS